MQKTIDLQQIQGFGPLLHAYLQRHPALPQPPQHTAQEIQKAIEKRGHFEHRQLLHSVITEQYKGLDVHPAVQQNIDRLLHNNSYCVTTGHQLTLMGGPLFVTYKILTTVQLAQTYRTLSPGHDFIPVFWLATEDHDREEINHFYFRGEKFTWETMQTGAVGRFICEGILPLIQQFRAQFPGMQDELLHLLEKAYAQPTLGKAMHWLANELFGAYGVMCIDADDRQLKEIFLPVALKEINENFVHKAVTEQNRLLEKAGFEPAIRPRETNLFLHTTHDRKRLETDTNGVRTADGSMSWDKKSFAETARLHPQDISPNVLLRPVYQELVLPNLAYVGGPAEIEYWLQLDKVFEALGIPVPARVLRICATVIPPAEADRMDQTGLDLKLFMGDEDRLTKTFLDRAAGQALDFTAETSELGRLFENLAKKARHIDATLEPAVMAEKTRQEKALENIFGRIRKAEKAKHEVDINRLKKLRNVVLPSGGLQERTYTLLDIQPGDRQRFFEKASQASLNTMNIIVP